VNRFVILLGCLALGACAAADPAPPPTGMRPELPADPVPEVEEPRAPAPDPEPTLEERWREPFAVHSDLRPITRTARRVVVLDGEPVRPPAAAPPPTRVAAAGPAEPAAEEAAPPTRAAEDAATRAAPAAAPATATAPAATPPAAAPAAAPRATTPAAAPATPAARAAPAAATGGARTHRVEWGETWLGIARRYGITSSVLAAANPDVDPERLRTGVTLRVPAAPATGSTPARAPAAAAAAPAPRTHTVGPGDTLWGIARRYGVPAEQVRSANKMTDDRVRLGQTLIIPRSESER
jgi:peptidoglycan DL-endopeptidase LytF